MKLAILFLAGAAAGAIGAWSILGSLCQLKKPPITPITPIVFLAQ